MPPVLPRRAAPSRRWPRGCHGRLSVWSEPCQFTVDMTRPGVPTVGSTDYPENNPYPGVGAPGLPGRFTFDANGSADVVGFRYGEFFASTFVAADRPGGSATVEFAPRGQGTEDS